MAVNFGTVRRYSSFSFFFFNDTATTEIYTLSLHDALPISSPRPGITGCACGGTPLGAGASTGSLRSRSEEHTSELQSRSDLVCRLLLEKKKKTNLHDSDTGSAEIPQQSGRSPGALDHVRVA